MSKLTAGKFRGRVPNSELRRRSQGEAGANSMNLFTENNPAARTNKFRGRYRIESTRLKGWDYSSEGVYFVTICARNREHFFGEITGGKMRYSRVGEMVANEWENTKSIRSNVTLDEWVVMPNHIHGIIIIDNRMVETHCNASLQEKSPTNRFGPQSNNLAAIIRGFKGVTTKNIPEEGEGPH